MTVATKKISQSSFYKERFNQVVDRSFEERSFIQQQKPHEEDEDFFTGLIESFTEPILESGRDLLKAGYALKEKNALENEALDLSENLSNLLERKTGPNALDSDEYSKQVDALYAKSKEASGRVDAFQRELEPFTAEKIARDFGSLALLIASFGVGAPAGVAAKTAMVAKFPQLAGVASRIARGGSMGSLLFSGDAVREGEDLAGILEAAGIGFVSGAAFDIATPLFPKAFRLGGRALGKAAGPLRFVESKIPGAKEFRIAAFSRTISRIENNYGAAGKSIADAWLAASRNGKEIAGQWIEKYADVGLAKLPRLRPGQKVGKVLADNDAWMGEGSLLDLLEGRVSPTDPRVTKATLAAYNVANESRVYIQQTAKETIKGFKSLRNYFPHHVPAPKSVRITSSEIKAGELFGKSGSLRNDVLKNSVYKQKVFKTMEEAQGVLDGWVAWVNAGGRIKGTPNAFIDWVAKKNRISRIEANNLADRLFIERPSARVPKLGSLEKGRDINFPFYDPDPRRVLPEYMISAVARTEVAAQFGRGDKLLNEWIASVRKGDALGYGFSKSKRKDAADKLDELVRVLLATTKKGAVEGEGASLPKILRAINTPLLSFAQIVNMGQTMTNVPLAADFPALFYGLRSVFRQDAVVEALRTGSVLSRVINDSVAYSSGSTEFSKRFLNATGFGWTELFNRTVSTHSGMRYFEQTALNLAKKPEDVFLKRQIEELGGNVVSILKNKGKVSQKEILRAGQIFSEKTQFLNDPASLPAFAASDWGKVIFQFKNFSYNQSILVKEAFAKRPIRTSIILATVFPMTAEVTTDIRSLVTQQKKPTKALDRYLWNITHAGSLGMATDILLSAKYQSLVDAGVGPTIGGVAQLGEAIVSSGSSLPPDPEPLVKFLLRRTGVGRIPVNIFSPPRGGKSSLESLGYTFD